MSSLDVAGVAYFVRQKEMPTAIAQRPHATELAP